MAEFPARLLEPTGLSWRVSLGGDVCWAIVCFVLWLQDFCVHHAGEMVWFLGFVKVGA